jgi:DNA polymerase (family 10)
MEPPLDAAAVARLLTEIGQRLELAGDEPFKARAYYRAAETLQALKEPLAQMVAGGKLRELPGVGEGLAEKIIRLHRAGTHPTLDYLREQVPGGLLEMLRIAGLGPKKVSLLHKTLNISTLEELEEACRAGRVAQCKGFGAALEKKIVHGIEFLRKAQGLWLVHKAEERLDAAREALVSALPVLNRFVPAGSLRRGCELAEELVLVAEGPRALIDAGAEPDALWRCAHVSELSGKKAADDSNDVRVYIAEKDQYGLALLFATGSASHVASLRARATEKGLELSEQGLRRGAKRLPCADEAAVYRALGLPCIAPELREGRGEIELADAGKLPALVADEDVRGSLHSHTNFSDGGDTLEAMAGAVRAHRWQYFGVADHSRSAFYAGGLTPERVREQHQLVDKLNAKDGGRGFRIFKGIESDILEHGELDYEPAVLRQFDFIIASIHSRFGLDRQAQTARIIKAVENPFTTILGHPTGRLLLQREAYAVDLEAILAACAKHGVAVEINAHPHRLDLDWRWHQRALELGCMLSINPDAHCVDELSVTQYGVRVARKGGVPKERVLNCMDLPAITRWFEARKERAGRG